MNLPKKDTGGAEADKASLTISNSINRRCDEAFYIAQRAETTCLMCQACVSMIQYLHDGLTWEFFDRNLRFATFAGLFPSCISS